MSMSDKGGRELAAAWLRRPAPRSGAPGVARPRPAGRIARAPFAKPDTVFHSDTHVGFSRV